MFWVNRLPSFAHGTFNIKVPSLVIQCHFSTMAKGSKMAEGQKCLRISSIITEVHTRPLHLPSFWSMLRAIFFCEDKLYIMYRFVLCKYPKGILMIKVFFTLTYKNLHYIIHTYVYDHETVESQNIFLKAYGVCPIQYKFV